MFMIESGSASLPPVSSLAKFIHDLGRRSGAPFPLTETWAHHGANHYYREYDEAVRRIHGEPATVAEYCWKGHLVTADQHRAMFEATAHRMWDVTSGFTQWKINACWPSVQWQIHDWYLKPTPSYYSIKRACEPLHVQLDLLDREVVVVNRRLSPASGLKARAAVYDLSARLAWEKAERIDAPANGFRRGFVVPIPDGVGPVHFVKLELRDAAGALASENFYWLSTAKPDDLRPLAELPLVDLEVTRHFERTSSGGTLRTRVRNPGPSVAFFVQLAATLGPEGQEILPVLWDDNYFSLLPGETREVGAAFDAEDLRADEPTLEVGGWNVRAPFECRRLELSRTVAAPGEHVLVTAEISRTFLDGSRVPVLVDGTVEGSLFAWARGDATDELLFNVKVGGPGEHEIRVGSTAARVTVRQ
jgi:exo-1,4-beta-D-glucosaminidase